MAARPEITGRAIDDLVWLRLGDIEPLAVTFKVARRITGLDALETRQGQAHQVDPSARHAQDADRLSLPQKTALARAD